MFGSNFSKNTVNDDLDNLKTFFKHQTHTVLKKTPFPGAPGSLVDFPMDIIIHLFQFIDYTPKDWIRISGVNKTWRESFHSELFCKSALYHHFSITKSIISRNFHHFYDQSYWGRLCFENLYKSHFRFLIMGANSCGKSTFVHRFVHKDLIDETNLGIYDTLLIGYEEAVSGCISVFGSPVKIELQDTNSTNNEYSYMLDQLIARNNGVIISFSLTSLNSFEEAKEMYCRVQRYKDLDDGKLPVVLVGLKSDDLSGRRVDQKVIDDYCNQTILKYVQVSAKDDINVELVFTTLFNVIYQVFFDWNRLQSGKLNYHENFLKIQDGNKNKGCDLM